MSNLPNLSETRVGLIQSNNSCFNVHDHLKGKTVEELRDITQSKLNPFWVMCLNVVGDLNVSTIIRTSHMFGADRVVIFGRRKIDSRGLVGAANYTTIEKVDGLLDDRLTINKDVFTSYINDNNLLPIFVEQGGHNVFDFDWNKVIEYCDSIGKKPCIIMGEENSGIPDFILNQYSSDCLVSIPQTGVIRSMNVSQAFAVVISQMIGKLGWWI